jgi:GTPase SAR1 family protein
MPPYMLRKEDVEASKDATLSLLRKLGEKMSGWTTAYTRKEKPMRLLMMGLDGVGKTAILQKHWGHFVPRASGVRLFLETAEGRDSRSFLISFLPFLLFSISPATFLS